MHDVMRERLWRKLQVLPDEQLYQVLDYIEFLESKYAPGRAAEPSPLQRFAERFEDRLRDLSVAPRYIKGAVGMFGTASSVMKGVVDASKQVVDVGISALDAGVEMVSGAAKPEVEAAQVRKLPLPTNGEKPAAAQRPDSNDGGT